MRRDVGNGKNDKSLLQGFLEGLGKVFVKYIGNPFDNPPRRCYSNGISGVTMNYIRPQPAVREIAGKSRTAVTCLENEKKKELIPANIVVGMNNAVNEQCLCISNLLRNKPRVAEWITETFGGKCDEVTNIWFKDYEELISVDAHNVPHYERKTDIKFERPILSCDYNHMLVLYSEDVNYLNYVKFEVEKYLKDIKALDTTYLNSSTKDEKIDLFNQVVGDMGGLSTDENDDKNLRSIIKSTALKFGLSEEEIEEIIKKNERKF